MENIVHLSKEDFDKIIKSEDVKSAHNHYSAAPNILRKEAPNSHDNLRRYFTYKGTLYMEGDGQ